MRVIGIDPGAKGALATIYDLVLYEEISFKTIKVEGHWPRIFAIVDLILHKAGWDDCNPHERLVSADLMLIEDYAHHAQGNTTFAPELRGVLMERLRQAGKIDRLVIVGIAQLKQFATGKGNDNKDVVMQQASKEAGRIFPSHDEADAYWLARIGKELLDPTPGLTKIRQQVLAKIRAANPALGGKA